MTLLDYYIQKYYGIIFQ